MKRERAINLTDEDVVKPLEELAAQISAVSKMAAAMKASKLKQDTIILLLHDMTKVSKRDIKAVLTALPELERKYLK